MASWMAWATMASPIQLPLPALKLVVYIIYFPLDFCFLSHFIVAIYVYRFNGLHIIPPLLPPGDHACVQKSWHLSEYKLFKTIPTLQMIACKRKFVYEGIYIMIGLLLQIIHK